MSIVQQVVEEPKNKRQVASAAEALTRLTLKVNEASESPDRLELRDTIDLYRSVGRRNIEYFAWIHDVYSWITLPCVSFDRRKILGEDKTKLAIFDILVDDLADNYTTRSFSLLEKMTNIPWQTREALVEGDEYLRVSRAIWEDLISSISRYPRFGELEKVFYFDLRQVLSSMMYSYLSNTEGIENPIETSFYSSYGCVVQLAIDMDLMCSPGFDMRELGSMRTVASLAQKVAHIGNLLTTYPRELVECDVSSPIISLALRKGLIRKEELGDKAILPKVSKLEWIFKNKAYNYIRKVAAYEKDVRSINMRGFSEYLLQLLERFEGTRSLR